MAYDRSNQNINFALFCVGFLLSFFEILQIFGGVKDYLADPWNYLDASRTAFLIMLALSFNSNVTDFADIYLVLSMISVVRGVSYFRLASHTRYMINLINEVLRDIFPFLLIVTYSTVSFGFLLMAMNFDSRNFFNYVVVSFIADLGNINSANYSTLQ